MKRKVILYISQSLDGFIADEHFGVDWIIGNDPDFRGDYGYDAFIKGIDTVLLGYRTYHQIITELSVDQWIYKGLKSYVFTTKQLQDTKDIEFVNTDAVSLVDKLTQQQGKNIWICGGADIVNQCIKANIIDEYQITTVPVILGKGIRLFDDNNPMLRLKHKKTRIENGLTVNTYTKA